MITRALSAIHRFYDRHLPRARHLLARRLRPTSRRVLRQLPKSALGAALVCVAGALALGGCTRSERRDKPKSAPQASAPQAPTKLALASVEQRLPKVARPLSWLSFGGGSEPLSNQVSLAQDLELARSLLAGTGLVLFASGHGALVAVERERAPSEGPHDLGTELARLFAPAGALALRYEPTALVVDAPATREHVLDALRAALASGTTPLLVYGASHGEQGARASENSMSLWGGWPLTVEDLADVLDGTEKPRPTRFVITSCYGGGFAELAFVAADPRKGVRSPEHCGLFAAPWDDESSGCDANPDRRAQDSYAIHFWNALRGQARDGADRLSEIDLDRDSRVGLLEAHAWARIHSRSLDVPTTTSERLLREYVRSYDAERMVPDPELEELSLVRALSAELELEDERSANSKLRELDAILADTTQALEEAQRTSDDMFYALRIALLERWPLLEHVWDPRTRAMIQREGPRILQMLTDSELSRSFASAARELDDALATQDAVRLARARVLRLVRGFETLRLATVLKRRGGARYEQYLALRQCERYVPEVRAPLRRAELARQPRISATAVEAEAHAK
jgi:hypothetical protein